MTYVGPGSGAAPLEQQELATNAPATTATIAINLTAFFISFFMLVRKVLVPRELSAYLEPLRVQERI